MGRSRRLRRWCGQRINSGRKVCIRDRREILTRILKFCKLGLEFRRALLTHSVRVGVYVGDGLPIRDDGVCERGQRAIM